MLETFYNEFDRFPAEWTRKLIEAGAISPGVVDERSISDLKAEDVCGYGRAHFFSGIGGWDYALRLAGWPPDRPVWTGSCPCQPFSAAGKGLGEADPRHLWPEFRRLISECRPPVVFGEQVASKAGRAWLSGVRVDLEAMGYAVGAADLCAAGAGAPHIRQRLFWVAYSGCVGNRGGGLGSFGCEASGVQGAGGERERIWTDSRASRPVVGGGVGKSDDATGARLGRNCGALVSEQEPDGHDASNTWSQYDLLPCADGKARRIEPGTFPLAHGVPARVGRLRGYGNAIVPQVAAQFVSAFMEAVHA